MLIQMARYDEETCNCYDMSGEVDSVLNKLGMPHDLVIGYNDTLPGENFRRGHRWIRIAGYDFECTCLTFMNVTKDWQHITIGDD